MTKKNNEQMLIFQWKKSMSAKFCQKIKTIGHMLGGQGEGLWDSEGGNSQIHRVKGNPAG
jgi:hypothetical protein